MSQVRVQNGCLHRSLRRGQLESIVNNTGLRSQVFHRRARSNAGISGGRQAKQVNAASVILVEVRLAKHGLRSL